MSFKLSALVKSVNIIGPVCDIVRRGKFVVTKLASQGHMVVVCHLTYL